MKRLVSLLLTLVAMVAMMVPAPAHAAPSCSAERVGESNNISIICRDDEGRIIPTPLIDILRIVGNIVTVVVTETREIVKEVLVPGPTRTVTASPQPQPTVTVTARPEVGPTATVTVRPETVEKTVTVPSETKTVTVERPRATATATVTVRPNGTTVTKTPAPLAPVTKTAQPAPRATETVTITASPTATPAGQIVPKDDTVDDGDTGFFRIDVSDDGEITVVETGIGLFSAALIFLIVLYAMYLAYGRGQRDAKNNETKFLRGILDRSKIRN